MKRRPADVVASADLFAYPFNSSRLFFPALRASIAPTAHGSPLCAARTVA